MSANATLFYIHDPMCSWCWAYRPTWLQLEAALSDAVKVEYIVGGLAPDSNEPMPKKMQATIQGYWRRIQSELGTEFNFDFWQQCQPRRSTYPACRAVIAAKQQEFEKQMIEAIQRAHYLRAMNPSDESVLISLAEEIGLDKEKFSQAMTSNQVEEELQHQIQFVQTSPCKGFPGLLLHLNDSLVFIEVDYKNAQTTLNVINQYLEGIANG